MFLLCPIVPLINPNYASPTSAQMIQHRLGDFKAHAEALQPCRESTAHSCSHQPETPDAVSSADLAFDQPLEGVPRSPGKTSAMRWVEEASNPLADLERAKGFEPSTPTLARCALTFDPSQGQAQEWPARPRN